MKVFVTIALRNITKNKKRSLIMGTIIFVSCLLLVFSNALGNGIGRQIGNQYRIMQSGDVAVAWENVKEYERDDPSRLLLSDFDGKKDAENKQALRRLYTFMRENAELVEYSYAPLRKFGTMDTGRYVSFITLYGISREEMHFLMSRNRFRLIAGYDLFEMKYGIYISQKTADQNNIRIGDWVILDAETKNRYVNSMEYRVAGIYKAYSEFDSIYVYMTRHDAGEFLDAEPAYFSTMRIYLKNPSGAKDFASRLDTFLLEESPVLCAESREDSTVFYDTIAGVIKILFTSFSVFLLFMVALGMRSAVDMNLFERISEFGTLRAIGFDRLSSFLIIFFEVWLLSLFALLAALAVAWVIVLVTAESGIYIGDGTISFAIGGDALFPLLSFHDLLATLVIITVFSLYTPLKPALRLVFQKITDMLEGRRKPVFAIAAFFRKLVNRRSG